MVLMRCLQDLVVVPYVLVTPMGRRLVPRLSEEIQMLLHGPECVTLTGSSYGIDHPSVIIPIVGNDTTDWANFLRAWVRREADIAVSE